MADDRTDLGDVGTATTSLGAVSATATMASIAAGGGAAAGAAGLLVAAAPFLLIGGAVLMAGDWIADSMAAADEDTKRMHDLADEIAQMNTDKQLLGKDMDREITAMGVRAGDVLEQQQHQTGTQITKLGKSIDSGMSATKGLVSGEMLSTIETDLENISIQSELQAQSTTMAVGDSVSGIKSKYDEENRELLAQLDIIQDEHRDLVDEAGADEKINFWDRMI